MDPTKAGVSVDLNVSFCAAAKVGCELQIEGTVLKMGRKLAFTEVTISGRWRFHFYSILLPTVASRQRYWEIDCHWTPHKGTLIFAMLAPDLPNEPAHAKGMLAPTIMIHKGAKQPPLQPTALMNHNNHH